MTLVATERDPVPHGAEVDRITAADGTVLRVARWLPSGGTRGTVVILNGRTEFVEKYFEVIGDLLRRHYAVATLDWRGQGLSDRPLRNRHKGHVRDFGLYVSDLRRMFTHFVEPTCPRPYRALSHSLGGCIALHYLALHPDSFASAIFSAPMWGIGRGVGISAPLRTLVGLLDGLGLGGRYLPGRRDYGDSDRAFAGNPFTRDAERFARFVAQVDAEPRLALGGPTIHWAREAMRAIAAIHAPGFAERVEIPIRVCTARDDSVVSIAAQSAVASRLANASQHVFEGARHELLMERDSIRNRFYTLFEEL
ncbi:MAG: alpha/beta hydrolase [Deltaproteobacteria bacterium]|nr:alpha/beta hydrolase [Deltaproteobacteria bacterium]MBW2401887.1 alpha/beta hydrolase [Deltaproteobacteria bacterium]